MIYANDGFLYNVDYLFTCQGDQGCTTIDVCAAVEEITGDRYLPSQDAIDRE